MVVGKKSVPPFISLRYKGITEMESQQRGEFPFDVKFYTKLTVRDLVELSKQYNVSEYVLLRLSKDADFPNNLLSAIEPLKQLRFFKEELLYELETRLSTVNFNLYHQKILQYCSDFSKLKSPLWDKDRAQAHLQTEDAIKRRASVSDYLWNIWKNYEKMGKRMTESQLKQHAECEQLGQNLTPPMWMQHVSRNTGKSSDYLWQQSIKAQGHNVEHLRRTHFKLLQETAREVVQPDATPISPVNS